MQTFVIDSFNGGLSKYDNKGIKGSFQKGSKGLNIRRESDSLSCNQGLADYVTTQGMATFFVEAIDSYFYAFTDTGRIYKCNSSGATLVYTGINNEQIRGACQWVDVYGNVYLYWTTQGFLHRKRILDTSGTEYTAWTDVDASLITGDATTSGDPWPKQVQVVTWNYMAPALGTMFVSNGQYMATVDADNSYNSQALDLSKLNFITTFMERGNSILIGTIPRNGSNTELYQWDGVSDTWNNQNIIGEKSVNAMADAEIPLMQAGDTGAFYIADASSKTPLFTVPGGGVTTESITFGSYPVRSIRQTVIADKSLVLIGIYDNSDSLNGVYSYGRSDYNDNRTLNLEYPITCDEMGGIFRQNDTLYVSYKSGSSSYIKKVDTTTKGSATYRSLVLRAPVPYQKQATFKNITLSTAPLPSGTSIQVWYRLDKNGSFVQALMEGGSGSFSTTNGQEAVFLVGALGEAIEVEVRLTPTANLSPEVYKIMVNFDL